MVAVEPKLVRCELSALGISRVYNQSGIPHIASKL